VLAIDPTKAASHRCYPSISLLVPLTGTTPWPERLAVLRHQAEARLRAEFGAGVDRRLLRLLEDAVGGAASPPGARSLGVFVSATTTAVVGLDVEVRERAVIDDTFATRALLAGGLRAPRYWVLALDLDGPRLLRGEGPHLRPASLEVPEPVADRLRAVDRALGAALGDSEDPVIVVASEPTASRFLARTRLIGRIEAVIRRAPDRSLPSLASTVEPALTDVCLERRVLAMDALDRAVRSGTAASGLEPAWRAAHGGPGLLLVEEAYEQPVRILPGGSIALVADVTAPDVVDDGVDDLMEAVLARHGRVELVPDGALTVHQRIAFVPAPRAKR